MSGGIDSSVAAILLKEQGYRVHGVYFDLWKYGEASSPRETSLKNLNFVSRNFNLEWELLDIKEIFHNTVIKKFFESLSRGETPNPCVICNPSIKFQYMISRMEKLGFDSIATGHFANISKDEHTNIFHLFKARDELKDQSYVLCLLNQFYLAKTLLPLGNITKDEVRKIGKNFGLPFTDQPESMDLCFVDNKNFQSFIHENLPKAVHKGEIVDINNIVVGEHKGLAFYTIGQRKGINNISGKPYYVIQKDVKNNRIVVDTADRPGRNYLIASKVNWISGKELIESKIMDVKIRYRAAPIKALVKPMPNNSVCVKFSSLIRDITPGQFAVFYENTELLGGGVITGREL